MPSYHVLVSEPTKLATGDEVSPLVRDTAWAGKAADERDAIENAWKAWEEQHGEPRPARAMRPIVNLTEGIRVWFVGGPLDSRSIDIDIVGDLPLEHTYAEGVGDGGGFQRGHVYRLNVKGGNEAQYVYEGPTSSDAPPASAP